MELAEFLLRTAIDFYRFRPGRKTVAGPGELTVITKPYGFQWIYQNRRMFRGEDAFAT